MLNKRLNETRRFRTMGLQLHSTCTARPYRSPRGSRGCVALGASPPPTPDVKPPAPPPRNPARPAVTQSTSARL
jgi:hypothetical protein